MSGIQETYPPTLQEREAEETPMDALPSGDRNERALEVANQLLDRLEALERKYGEKAVEQGLEMAHDEAVL